MKLNDETRTRLLVQMTLDTDPTGSTVELKIDDTWYPATWQGSPVSTGKHWTQTMRTTGYFAGPLAVASGATVLAIGRHLTETRVSWPGGDIIVSESSPIDVKTNASVGPPATDARVAATVTALDADATSAYRVQSDARLAASFASKATQDTVETGRLSASALSASVGQLTAWAKNPDNLVVGALTYDSGGLLTTAAVVWPDGATGTLTITTRHATSAVTGYTITRVVSGQPTKTYTQPTITRDSSGLATLVPQITVA